MSSPLRRDSPSGCSCPAALEELVGGPVEVVAAQQHVQRGLVVELEDVRALAPGHDHRRLDPAPAVRDADADRARPSRARRRPPRRSAPRSPQNWKVRLELQVVRRRSRRPAEPGRADRRVRAADDLVRAGRPARRTSRISTRCRHAARAAPRPTQRAGRPLAVLVDLRRPGAHGEAVPAERGDRHAARRSSRRCPARRWSCCPRSRRPGRPPSRTAASSAGRSWRDRAEDEDGLGRTAADRLRGGLGTGLRGVGRAALPDAEPAVRVGLHDPLIGTVCRLLSGCVRGAVRPSPTRPARLGPCD